MNARLIAAAEKYYRVMYDGGAESWNLRDSHMAETLAHLLEQGGPTLKALVWAHNSHIGDASDRDGGRPGCAASYNIGQLAARARQRGRLIGFGTYTGTVAPRRATGTRRKRTSAYCLARRQLLSAPCHDSGRALLPAGSRGRPDERFAGASRTAARTLHRRDHRPETERWSHHSTAVLPEQLDACGVVRRDARARGRWARPELDHGPPETHPFGV